MVDFRDIRFIWEIDFIVINEQWNPSKPVYSKSPGLLYIVVFTLYPRVYSISPGLLYVAGFTLYRRVYSISQTST